MNPTSLAESHPIATPAPAPSSDGEMSADRRPRRSRGYALIRVALSLGLLGYVLSQVTLTEFAAVFADSNRLWPLLVVGAALPIFGNLFAACRWSVLLAARGTRIPVRHLFEANLVGVYFNQAMPSTIGGDFARSWWISERHGTHPSGTSSNLTPLVSMTVVGVERFTGLIGMCAVAVMAAIASPAVAGKIPGLWLIVAGILTLPVVVFIIAVSQPTTSLGRWLFSLRLLSRLREKAAVIHGALKAYQGQSIRVMWAVLLSIGLQLMIITQFWVFGMAFGLDLSISSWAILVPIVNLVSMVPLTINGIGIRENALVFLGAGLGLTAGGAVAVALSVVLTMLAYAVLGAFVHLRGRRAIEWHDQAIRKEIVE